MIPDEWLDMAAARIAPHIVETPLSWDGEREIYLKWENHQVTGSFKARGAFNKVLSLADWERAAGLVAASAGNHGQGVALAAKLIGVRAEVFVPAQAGPAKIAAMRGMGAEVRAVEGGYSEAEYAARAYAAAEGKAFVSPYNDAQIVAGQGTMALECWKQLKQTEPSNQRMAATTWIVPIGGGGLISGFGAALSRREERHSLIGVQAEASPFTYSQFYHHTQEGIEDRPTLAEGLSGAIEADSLTIPMMQRYMDEVVLVSEHEIRDAIAFAWRTYAERIEGSAAVGLAAILSHKIKVHPAIVVITGGNIEDELHERIIGDYAARVED